MQRCTHARSLQVSKWKKSERMCLSNTAIDFLKTSEGSIELLTDSSCLSIPMLYKNHRHEEGQEIVCICRLLRARRQWQATPVLLPGESHRQRSLVGCSPWGREESETTEWPHFHFSLSSIGEGNGNSLQCSCLENPKDQGAWWAAVYGVAQSWTQLKRLSSSSSRGQAKGGRQVST